MLIPRSPTLDYLVVRSVILAEPARRIPLHTPHSNCRPDGIEPMPSDSQDPDLLVINTIRTLAMDAVAGVGDLQDVGGLARFQNDRYHQVERQDTSRVPGNPWFICTVWLARYQLQRAQTREDLAPGLKVLEWAAERCRSTSAATPAPTSARAVVMPSFRRSFKRTAPS